MNRTKSILPASLNWARGNAMRERTIDGHKAMKIIRLALCAASLMAWQTIDAEESDVKLHPPISDAERRELLAEQKRVDNEAERLAAQGRIPEAFLQSEQSMRIARRVFGEINDDVASTLGWIAERNVERGDFAAAKRSSQQALSILTKLHGASDWRTIDARWSLGDIDKYAQLTTDERRDLFAPDGADRTFNVLCQKGEWGRAAAYAKRTLNIRRRILGEAHPAYAANLNNLADVYRSQGDYVQAKRLLQEALTIRQRILPPSHPGYAQGLNSLANLYYWEGDVIQAEALFRESMEIVKKSQGRKNLSYVTLVNNMGEVYLDQGDFARAEPMLREALEGTRTFLGEMHPDYAGSLSKLACLYVAEQAYARAEPLVRQSLEIRKKVQGVTHPDYGASLNNLAQVYLRLGDYARAEALCRESLAVIKQTRGEAHPDYAACLGNLAGLFLTKGDVARAKPLFIQAEAITQKTLGDMHPDHAVSLNALASSYLTEGDFARAEPPCRRALEIMERHFAAIGQVQSERRQLAFARTLRINLDAFLSVGLDTPVMPDDLYQHVLRWKGAAFIRQRAGRALHSRPEFKSIFQELAGIDVRLSNAAFRGPSGGDRTAWEQEIDQLTIQKDSLEGKLAAQSAALQTAQSHFDLLPSELRQRLPANVALIDFLEYWHTSPAADRRSAIHYERRLTAFVLRRDQPIVRIELGPAQSLGAAAERWRQAIVDRGGGAEEALDTKTALATELPQHALKSAIWRPLEKYLKGAEIVLVSPDGVLNQVPFAALPGNEPGSYLLEEIKLAVVPVPRLIPQFLGEHNVAAGGNPPPSTAKPDENSILIVGDVDYGPVSANMQALKVGNGSVRSPDRFAAMQFTALPYTATEMAQVKHEFQTHFPAGQVRTLSKSAATESAFQREGPHSRWLHLATHGFFAPPALTSVFSVSQADPNRAIEPFGHDGLSGLHPGLLSGLALANANARAGSSPDNGILTAVAVAGMDLERVELAVLSACETGLGTVADGEGLLGLQRAFQIAGARTTIASLWKIPDQTTSELMAAFYENLWGKKVSKLDALRDAQLTILRGARRGEPLKDSGRSLDFEHSGFLKSSSLRLPPFEWAAFVLSGDWR
jgi:CHAT domain-containing protein/Tfp pilus assembly protein PilF